LIRSGANRVVLLVGRYAIKVPRPTQIWYGRRNNLNEAAWCHHRGACPVTWCSPAGIVLVMRRARSLTSQEWAIIRKAPDAFHDRALQVEAKPDSFGILNGRIVVTDYGWIESLPRRPRMERPILPYIALGVAILVVVYVVMWFGGFATYP
jgi:hypothetical protein